MKINLRIFQKMGIRSRLILMYILMLSVPLCVLSIRYYNSTRDMIYDIVRKNVQEIVKKNNEVLDSTLKRIKGSCWDLMSDREFIEKSSSLLLDNDYKMISMDIELTKILDKYFLSYQDISFVQLVTSQYIFGYSTTMGNNRSYIPIESFLDSGLYYSAVNAHGKLIWYPTYNFSEKFKQSDIKDAQPEYKYMFSALQHMKTSNIRFGKTGQSGETVENPVLIINFGENFYDKVFKSSITMDNSYFFVITGEGQFISHQDKSKIGRKQDFPWLKDIVKKRSGQDIVNIDGSRILICYDTSDETGWISVIAIDYYSFLKQIISQVQMNSVYIIAGLILVLLLISYFVSYMISKPVTNLSKAINMAGDGDFSIKVPEEGSIEFTNLISKFNSMNEKIQKLIQENYEIKIKEKEAEINALNLQLDPHFMYNTLNIVNLKLIQSGHDEASEILMSLSAMLKFNARNKSTEVPFEQELDYLKGYIHIMAMRLDGKFTAEYDIDPELFEYNVPKFMLQPFVENSLIHGFEMTRTGGLLKITGRMEKNRRVFIIEDNGKGMDGERITEIMEGRTNSVGIRNVRDRIQIIYGMDYGIHIASKPLEGTIITIWLPGK